MVFSSTKAYRAARRRMLKARGLCQKCNTPVFKADGRARARCRKHLLLDAARTAKRLACASR